MNTRLQVEHPVTEMVTGYDLVEWQIRVARGEDLPQSRKILNYLDTPLRFVCTRRIRRQDFAQYRCYQVIYAAAGPGIRVDAGVETGDEVTPFYDAMVAKLITYGDTREDARLKMKCATGHGFVWSGKQSRLFD